MCQAHSVNPRHRASVWTQRAGFRCELFFEDLAGGVGVEEKPPSESHLFSGVLTAVPHCFHQGGPETPAFVGQSQHLRLSLNWL